MIIYDKYGILFVMKKELNKPKYKIIKGKTLYEYRYYFGDHYDKGKLLSYSKDEMWAMHPKRTYWEIDNKYYELPIGNRFLHITPPSYIRHRRSKLIALSIIGGSIILATGSFYIGKVFYRSEPVPIIPSHDFKEAAINYKKYTESGIEITERVDNISLLTAMAMGNTLYTCDGSGDNITANRRNFLSVGYGHTITDILITTVDVNISNAFIQKVDNNSSGEKAEILEEAISFGPPITPRVGHRDYRHVTEDNIDSGNTELFHGSASSSTSCDYDSKKDFDYNRKEYMDKIGIDPNNPFLYVINNATVLTDKVYDIDPVTEKPHYGNSNIVKHADDKGEITSYTINLDLHNELSVTRYMKRMKYVSNLDPNFFNYITLTLDIDKEFKITKMSVKEKYNIVFVDTYGEVDTKFYYDEVPDIPKIDEKFDYSKYPK